MNLSYKRVIFIDLDLVFHDDIKELQVKVVAIPSIAKINDTITNFNILIKIIITTVFFIKITSRFTSRTWAATAAADALPSL